MDKANNYFNKGNIITFIIAVITLIFLTVFI